ncbi:MAG: hypothetical protein ABUL57_00675, partial [Chloroflexota bacterium]
MSTAGTPYLDGRPSDERSPIRFIAFGLAVVLAASVLTVRLFALQIASGERYTALAEINRSTTQAVPSIRGVIYDRNGVPLVTNVASWAVKLRPADLPLERRPGVVQRLAGLLKMDPVDINIAIDSNAGSRFDLVRIASNVDPDIASFISESSLDLPGVEVQVESTR